MRAAHSLGRAKLGQRVGARGRIITVRVPFTLSYHPFVYPPSSPDAMFSFFSRKQQQPPAIPTQSDLESHAMVVDSVPQQLRTPSPSEAASNGLATHTLMASPSHEIHPLDPPKPALPPTPEALHALVTTIPAKTLHAYVLANIPIAPPDTLTALASFFATLTPPPRLHCVRCHADYTEVENTDRSCHVPHDDDSAYVERVGMCRGGSEYETQYGCCGKTVEGEGDLGPPDGWCYEGLHTVSSALPLPPAIQHC